MHNEIIERNFGGRSATIELLPDGRSLVSLVAESELVENLRDTCVPEIQAAHYTHATTGSGREQLDDALDGLFTVLGGCEAIPMELDAAA